MVKIERILCPVDFSEFSIRAYNYAESLARHYKAKLFLQTVVEPVVSAYPYYPVPESLNEIYSDLITHAQEHLQRFLKEHRRNGVEVESAVDGGTPPDLILGLAQAKAVDLIVMGTHGRRGFDRMVLGSVTERVLRKARCPVLVVRKPAHDFVDPNQKDDSVQLRKILFCTDFSEHSERALEYALSLATEYDAELTLLHVLDETASSTELKTATEDAIRKLQMPVPADAQKWFAIKSLVRVGAPHEQIIQLALEAQIDLVIMGVRGRNALDLALFGSTTHRVIQLGPCPVLAVHI